MCDDLGEAARGVQPPGIHGSAVLCCVVGSIPWQLMEFVFMETKRWTKLLSPAMTWHLSLVLRMRENSFFSRRALGQS